MYRNELQPNHDKQQKRPRTAHKLPLSPGSGYLKRGGANGWSRDGTVSLGRPVISACRKAEPRCVAEVPLDAAPSLLRLRNHIEYIVRQRSALVSLCTQVERAFDVRNKKGLPKVSALFQLLLILRDTLGTMSNQKKKNNQNRRIIR